jgi:FkbM family methyltransferase
MLKSSSFKLATLRLLLQVMPDSYKNRLAVHLGRPDIGFSLSQLRNFGYRPRQVLDGGAYRGEWARYCLAVWPEASVLCIEPQDATQADLSKLAQEKAPNVTIIKGLLGPTDDPAVSFAAAGTGGSVLAANAPSSTSAMWSIDSLISQRNTPFDFVKLDVQGYELQILSGFEKYLPHCTMLQLELSLIPIVEGAPIIAEVVAYLDQRGFVLYDFDEIIRSPSDGAVWQVDALFCRRNSHLRTNRTWR